MVYDDTASLVDRVVCVDYGARGVVSKLYQAAYTVVGRPLCKTAAQVLEKFISAGGSVLLATGFRVLRFGGRYETDGVISSTILASILSREFNADVGVVVDSGFGQIFKSLAGKGGLKRLKILELPPGDMTHQNIFKRFVEELNPSISIAVERPAANFKGVYHNSRGQDISSLHSKIDQLLKELRDDGVPLIAVGDGGNEVGMAVVREAVEEYVPYGRVCVCGCGGGIASSTACDYPVIASVSDLGVYGILALLTDGSKMLPPPSLLEKIFDRALEMGCVDAVYGPGYRGVDGVDVYSIQSVIKILDSLVHSST